MAGRAVRERIQQDLSVWFTDGVIDQETLDALRERYTHEQFGLAGVVKYIGITGGLFTFFGVLGAIGAAMQSVGLGMILAGGIGAALVAWGLRLDGDLRERYATSSKVVLTIGVMLCVAALGMLATLMGMKEREVLLVLGLLGLPAGFTMAYRYRNTYLLILALLAFFHWIGSWCTMWGDSTYVFAVQDPIVMSAVAAAVAGVGVYHERKLYPRTGRFYLAWESLGLVYLNMSLLILSIWGHYDHGGLAWIVVFTLVTVGQIVLGAFLQNGLFRGFGITFFAINIFTRFHETFWEQLALGAYLLVGGAMLVAAGAVTEMAVRAYRRSRGTP